MWSGLHLGHSSKSLHWSSVSQGPQGSESEKRKGSLDHFPCAISKQISTTYKVDFDTSSFLCGQAYTLDIPQNLCIGHQYHKGHRVRNLKRGKVLLNIFLVQFQSRLAQHTKWTLTHHFSCVVRPTLGTFLKISALVISITRTTGFGI